MLRPLFALRLALACTFVAWPLVAVAQTEPAPVEPAPPAPAPPAPAPGAPAPPAADEPAAPPPSEPAPPTPAPPTTPAPVPPAAPPSGSFPAPAPPADQSKPAPKPMPPAPPPARARDESPPSAAPAPTEKPAPRRATEGLFEEKPNGAGEVRHHEDEKDDDVDNFKIGPVAGVGVPSVLAIGGTLKLTRFLGAGVNLGLIPKVALSYYGKATLSYQHLDFYGRLYPFGGGFFLQGGAGYAQVDGTMQSSYSATAATLPMPIPGFPTSATATYDGEGSVRTLMLTALLGYFYTTSIGFSFGIDAGVQLPIAPSQIEFSSTMKSSPPGVDQLPPVTAFKKESDDAVRSTLEKIGRTPLPTVNLRIGWIL